MKTAVFWGITLLLLAGYEAEGFTNGAHLPSLDGLKEKLEKLKDSVSGRLSSAPPTLNKLNTDVSKEMMEKFATISTMKIKDAKAFHKFVTHLIHAHATHALSKSSGTKESVEESLKEHFNQAMSLAHKAFGKMDSNSLHNMMNNLRNMLPKIVQNKVEMMKKHLESKGRTMTRTQLMIMIREHTRPKPEDMEDDEEYREQHYHHRRRHMKKIIMAVTIPIGAIILIALIAAGIYCLIKSKRDTKEDSDGIHKLPSKKTNPYADMSESKSASFA